MPHDVELYTPVASKSPLSLFNDDDKMFDPVSREILDGNLSTLTRLKEALDNGDYSKDQISNLLAVIDKSNNLVTKIARMRTDVSVATDNKDFVNALMAVIDQVSSKDRRLNTGVIDVTQNEIDAAYTAKGELPDNIKQIETVPGEIDLFDTIDPKQFER